jgi:hypothetical protein
MSRLADITIFEPMRLAFDSIDLKRTYLKAIRFAHSYGQKICQITILYNFKDTP